MTEPKDRTTATSDGASDERERSTLSPPFDPAALAREVLEGAGGASASASPRTPLSLANARAPSSPPPTTRNPDFFAATEPPPTKDSHAVRPRPLASAKEMNDRVALGDYSGALKMAEELLAKDVTDAVATACAERCKFVLRQMYTARIGPLDRIPMVMVARDQLRWLSIDHRAGFILSLVDGCSTLEMILDVSAMPSLDALRILADLAQQRIISFR
jgi:hypothetical protein